MTSPNTSIARTTDPFGKGIAETCTLPPELPAAAGGADRRRRPIEKIEARLGSRAGGAGIQAAGWGGGEGGRLILSKAGVSTSGDGSTSRMFSVIFARVVRVG